jgi:hypothetical protein
VQRQLAPRALVQERPLEEGGLVVRVGEELREQRRVARPCVGRGAAGPLALGRCELEELVDDFVDEGQFAFL